MEQSQAQIYIYIYKLACDELRTAKAEEHNRKGMSLTFPTLPHSSTSLPKVMIPITAALNMSLAKAQVVVLVALHLDAKNSQINNGLGKGNGSSMMLEPFTSENKHKNNMYMSYWWPPWQIFCVKLESNSYKALGIP